ncbi:hypothetical protein L596_020552 [Steinernema carpocapsae]|uniref:Secreted protein n=1 Tax=Steinernema carpocapsae TaxID=34508 RepID=A0A4U5MTV8_STECR|nr:hypothetical protein L596_020552 [Steinernema carpocapsae]
MILMRLVLIHSISSLLSNITQCTDRAHFWGKVVFKGADYDSGVRMARNGFRTAQYGKVWIKQKREFYKSLSGPDAITLHKPQSATMKTE